VALAQLDNPNLWAPAVARITELHQAIVSHAQVSLQTAIAIGQILEPIKSTLKHGEWIPWIEKYLTFTPRTAQNYLRLYENRELLKNETVSHLSDAYSLLLTQQTNGSTPDKPQQLHEPNFHSQAVRMRQNLVGGFNHYLQRRPLKAWETEEIFDLVACLKPLKELVDQLESELKTRPDAPPTSTN